MATAAPAGTAAQERGKTALLSATSAMTFVVLFGFISLFSDMTYEGGRSLSGQYLRILGSSAAAVGIAAGAGEFLGYALRFVSGYISDRTGRYWPITIAGYVINLVAIPCLAFTNAWPAAIGLLFAERIGKGIRNPSRDAMLSYATKEMGRGWGYGIHEAMDQTGAFLGPLVMSAVLFLHAGERADVATYQLDFKLLFIPAGIAVVILLVARLIFPTPSHLESKTPKASAQGLTRKYWLYLAAAGLVGAGFADFALMAYHLKSASVAPDAVIPAFYSLAMGVGVVTALVGGKLYDRTGFWVLIGATIVAALSAPLVFLGNVALVVIGIVLWGIGSTSQSSIMRAALADMVPQHRRAYGFGLFSAAFGAFWFAGSTLMGVLYDHSVLALVIFSVAIQILSVPLFVLAKNTPLDA